MKRIITGLAAIVILATVIPASAEVKMTGLPKGWHVGKVNDPEKGDKCSVESGRQIVVTNDCVTIANGGKRCKLDCVPLNSVERR